MTLFDYILTSIYFYMLVAASVPYLAVVAMPSVRWLAGAACIAGIVLAAGWVAVFRKPPHWELDFMAVAVLIATSALIFACLIKALTLNLAMRGFSVWLRSAILVAGLFAAPWFTYPVSTGMHLLDIPMQPRFDYETLK